MNKIILFIAVFLFLACSCGTQGVKPGMLPLQHKEDFEFEAAESKNMSEDKEIQDPEKDNEFNTELEDDIEDEEVLNKDN